MPDTIRSEDGLRAIYGTPGNLAAGRSKTVKFKVKIKKRAKKGKKAKITFTAYAKGAKKKSGNATVKAR